MCSDRSWFGSWVAIARVEALHLSSVPLKALQPQVPLVWETKPASVLKPAQRLASSMGFGGFGGFFNTYFCIYFQAEPGS